MTEEVARTEVWREVFGSGPYTPIKMIQVMMKFLNVTYEASKTRDD
jgi:hypothetical protein